MAFEPKQPKLSPAANFALSRVFTRVRDTDMAMHLQRLITQRVACGEKIRSQGSCPKIRLLCETFLMLIFCFICI